MRPAARVGLVLALLPLLSCGKRGDPLPPLPLAPQPPLFSLAQRGQHLELSYVAPRLTTGGAHLGVLEVELLRLDGPGELDRQGLKERRKVAPGESQRQRAPLPPPGTTVRMAARAIHRGEPSPLSRVITLVAQPPLPPPPSLSARLLPSGVALTWSLPTLPPPVPALVPLASPSPRPTAASPPPSPPAASPSPAVSPTPPPTPAPARVRLYRRVKDGEWGPLVPDPLSGTTFEDAAAAPGQTWCYVARTVTTTDPLVESAESPEACVESKDVFPPAAPTGLAVLAVDEGVEVSWSPSSDADLAGYRLYRASGGAAPQRVKELPATETRFRERPGEGLHVYTLTAIDGSGNESVPSAPASLRWP